MLPVMGFMRGVLNRSILATAARGPPGVSRIARRRRRRAARAPPRGVARSASGRVEKAVFEGHDAQTAAERREVHRRSRKSGTRRLADGLVAGRERLVEQHAAGRQRGRSSVGNKRAPQVVRDDDGVEAPAGKRPRRRPRCRRRTPRRCRCSGAIAAASRSTAVTREPRAASQRMWRPLPQATSSTRAARRGSGAPSARPRATGRCRCSGDGGPSEAGPDPVGEVDRQVGPQVGGEHRRQRAQRAAPRDQRSVRAHGFMPAARARAHDRRSRASAG